MKSSTPHSWYEQWSQYPSIVIMCTWLWPAVWVFQEISDSYLARVMGLLPVGGAEASRVQEPCLEKKISRRMQQRDVPRKVDCSSNKERGIQQDWEAGKLEAEGEQEWGTDRKNPPEPSLCAEQVCRSSLFRQCVVLLTVVAERRWQDAAAAAAKPLQSCPTLCSPPGSPVPGILQARTLE